MELPAHLPTVLPAFLASLQLSSRRSLLHPLEEHLGSSNSAQACTLSRAACPAHPCLPVSPELGPLIPHCCVVPVLAQCCCACTWGLQRPGPAEDRVLTTCLLLQLVEACPPTALQAGTVVTAPWAACGAALWGLLERAEPCPALGRFHGCTELCPWDSVALLQGHQPCSSPGAVVPGLCLQPACPPSPRIFPLCQARDAAREGRWELVPGPQRATPCPRVLASHAGPGLLLCTGTRGAGPCCPPL